MTKKEKVRKRYDSWSTLYDLFDLGGLSYEKCFAVDALELKGNERVLDFGTGTGAILPYIASKLPNGKIYAVDFSQKMLAKARIRVKQCGLEGRVEIVRDDCESLKFPSNFFDCALASYTFTSLPNPYQGALEFARVLKRNGRFAVVDTGKPKDWYLLPYYWLLKPVARIFGYTYIDRNIPELLLKAGLEIERLYRFGLTYCVKGRKR